MLVSVGDFSINLVIVSIHSQRNVGIRPFKRFYLSLCVWILMHVYVHHVQVPSGTWEGHQIFCVTEITRGTWILGAKEQKIFTPFPTSLQLSIYTSWWKFQSEHDYVASMQLRNRTQCTSSCSSCPDRRAVRLTPNTTKVLCFLLLRLILAFLSGCLLVYSSLWVSIAVCYPITWLHQSVFIIIDGDIQPDDRCCCIFIHVS